MACKKDCLNFASEAKDRISIEVRADVDDDYGGRTTGWSEETAVWAVIYPMSGREIIHNEAKDSRVSHRFLIRHQTALKDTNVGSQRRVVFDGRTFPIKYVRNLDLDGKRHGTDFQELYCEENAPENV